MPKSAVWSETYCKSNGRNRIAPTDDPVEYPHFFERDPSLTTYYYDPRKLVSEFLTNRLSSTDLGILGSFIGNVASGLVDKSINDVCAKFSTSADGTKNYLATKCYNKPERILRNQFYIDMVSVCEILRARMK